MQRLQDEEEEKSVLDKSSALLQIALLVAVAFGFLAFLFGCIFISTRNSLAKQPISFPDYIRKYFMTTIHREQCDKLLYELTRNISLSGTQGGHDMANFIEAEFKSYGLKAHKEEYHAYLSYPTNNNELSVVNDAGTVVFTLDLYEKPISEDGTSNIDPQLIPPFNAYSANGTIPRGKLVYANYGRLEDFEYLVNDLRMDLSGKVVIVRYGYNFRGLKVMLAQKYNASGVIIYSDPADDGAVNGKQYPDGPWRPDSSLQRGSAYYKKWVGDVSTPFYPSFPNTTRRLSREENENIPKIPILPISAANAKQLMNTLQGSVPPSNWKGGLTNVAYNIGDSSNGGTSIRLTVQMKEEIRPIYNVIATIKGDVEPDREVIVGNHYDAWIFGAVDPHTGTVTLLEIARTLGALLTTGWRPRRTITLIAWDGEEYGLVGSTEHCEAHSARLTSDAIAYLNVDLLTGSDTMRINTSPLLSTLLLQETKRVHIKNHEDKQVTLYELWKENIKGQEPTTGYLGSGSDFTAFYQFLGIPSADLSLRGPYGTYHSVFDSYDYVKKVVDPEFNAIKAFSEYLAFVMLRLSEDLILPFDVSKYISTLESELKILESGDNLMNKYRAQLSFDQSRQLNDSLAELEANIGKVKSFAESGILEELETVTTAAEKGQISDLKFRAMNDRLVSIEKCFIDDLGLPGRTWFRHLLFAPVCINLFLSYYVVTTNFSIIRDTTKDMEKMFSQL
jgi:hypothetical protein